MHGTRWLSCYNVSVKSNHHLRCTHIAGVCSQGRWNTMNIEYNFVDNCRIMVFTCTWLSMVIVDLPIWTLTTFNWTSWSSCYCVLWYSMIDLGQVAWRSPVCDRNKWSFANQSTTMNVQDQLLNIQLLLTSLNICRDRVGSADMDWGPINWWMSV